MRWWLIGALCLAGCGGDDDDATPKDGGVDMATPDAAPAIPSIQSGEWAVGLELAEFGGLVLQTQLLVEITDGTFTKATLRAVGGGNISDELGDAAGATVDADGQFSLNFGDIVLPGPFSPTNSDVSINLILNGTIRAEDDFCGDTRGIVTTFDTVLEASTFGAVPWVDANTPGPGSCDAGPVDDLPRIETCPDLEPGMVEGFETGGATRSFSLQVPTDYDAGEMWPLIIGHHGLGGSPEGLGLQSGLTELVDDEGFILVMPQGGDTGSAWNSSSAGDNEDLALFDDIVRCVSEQYSVDAARIHSIGHSAGGYYNSYLTLRRAEVLASTAGMSPGLTIEYEANDTPPMIVAWGGAEDIAFDQDFDASSKKVMDTFVANGHFVVGCDHSPLPLREDLPYQASRHTFPIDGGRWLVRFLLDHPKGVDPLPYAMGLPEALPSDLCQVWPAP